MDFVISVEDYEGIRVRCSRERWEDHILVNHPELMGKLDAARQAIEERDAVFRDRTYGDRKHHIRRQPNGLLLNVIVKYRYDRQTLETVGDVVTAFFQRRLRDGDYVLYVRS